MLNGLNICQTIAINHYINVAAHRQVRVHRILDYIIDGLASESYRRQSVDIWLPPTRLFEPFGLRVFRVAGRFQGATDFLTTGPKPVFFACSLSRIILSFSPLE